MWGNSEKNWKNYKKKKRRIWEKSEEIKKKNFGKYLEKNKFREKLKKKIEKN